MMRGLKILIFMLFAEQIVATAQTEQQLNSGEIYQQMVQFNTLARVLYVAAHPDDENTRLIAHFARSVGAKTAYLSLTRGDGGQNLIGSEIREALGVIRTEELLAARQIDGADQFFTRANDFGYSKTPRETFQIWDSAAVLSDVVRVIRQFKPDIMITRFSETPGITHGHHTASAILARKGFSLAGNSEVFPDQLELVEPWQPRSLFWNTSSWFFRGDREFDTAKYIQIEVAEYLPSLGRSVTEIASLSRSQHKSQGFGARTYRNKTTEYLEQWEGDRVKSPLTGVDISWNRLKGMAGEKLFELGNKLTTSYQVQDPSASLPILLEMKNIIDKLPSSYWKEQKEEEVNSLIKQVGGLYLEVASERDIYHPGDSIFWEIEVTNRNFKEIAIKKISCESLEHQIDVDWNLKKGETATHSDSAKIGSKRSFSSPYWLRLPHGTGMYQVESQEMIGQPRNREVFVYQIDAEIGGQQVSWKQPLRFKEVDPVKGEYFLPIEIVPEVSVDPDRDILIFPQVGTQQVTTAITASADLKGKLSWEVPADWSVVPQRIDVDLKKGQAQEYTVSVESKGTSLEGHLEAVFESEKGEQYGADIQYIDYPHIRRHVLLNESSVKLLPLQISRQKKKIGYFEGAGDEIPSYLRLIGYEVEMIDPNNTDLNQYESIIIGIRAYNTRDDLSWFNQRLFDYVENGGTLITQYNTSYRMVTEEVSPLPLELSRDRVTDENSPVSFIRPEHPVLNQPNKITQEDFDGWVQERGLYFPDKWDDQFEPILELRDLDEDPTRGALLVAEFGEGHFVYTGLSFFRELPAGVPGAYRLLVNLIELN